MGQFDHWATPYAKDLNAPSLNTIAPMLLELIDSTGSVADTVRVAIRKLGGKGIFGPLRERQGRKPEQRGLGRAGVS